MAHSAGKTLSAVLLLVAVAAVGGRIHAAELASVDYRRCNDHLSANYTDQRQSLQQYESSDNISGYCYLLQCWCQTRCTSETVAAAPIPA
uniref:Bifunctional inhibitor/plant lipid transfer protein/seed storage helical domain-containing protein n=1 Tax=Setaria viridis TaxID=4556 RepID=A0A4U6TP83_SETVI|nr:hypothetical protein SEVIR_8G241200v2 [Setaria viridis]